MHFFINGLGLVCEIQKSAQSHIDRAKRMKYILVFQRCIFILL